MPAATFKNILIRIFVAITTILAIRACLPEKVKLVENSHLGENRKLIIVPTDGFPSLFLTSLRTKLQAQHKFEVLTTVQMALPPNTEIGSTGQHEAVKLAEAGVEVCRNMAINNEYCVVLTNRDINTKESGLRFLFAQHYKGISVVSTARLNEANFGAQINLISTPIITELIVTRTAKLVNKGLGLGYYGYALNNNRRSVMFAPIMGLPDLDSAGDWYLENEVHKSNYENSY
jgi:predicted Zn-dependent protease